MFSFRISSSARLRSSMSVAVAIPSCYLSLFIFERSSAEQKPPKLAVVPQQSSFEFMGLPLKKSLLSFIKEVFSIFRVNEFIVHPDLARAIARE